MLSRLGLLGAGGADAGAPEGLPTAAALGGSTVGLVVAAYGYELVRVNAAIPRGEHAAVARHLRDAHGTEPLPRCTVACRTGRRWARAIAVAPAAIRADAG